ncbi:TPA: hypothetical protein ACQ71T_004431, partial [Escherichia coli]
SCKLTATCPPGESGNACFNHHYLLFLPLFSQAVSASRQLLYFPGWRDFFILLKGYSLQP